MQPSFQPTPRPLPTEVIAIEAILRCPACKEGLGFAHKDRIAPGLGITVVCPKCGQSLGVKLEVVDLGKPKRLIM